MREARLLRQRRSPAARRRRSRRNRPRALPPPLSVTRRPSTRATVCPRWNTTPLLSCSAWMNRPTSAPMTRSSGTLSGATTSTSMLARAQRRGHLEPDEARADDDHALRRVPRARRSRCCRRTSADSSTCPSAAPGMGRRTGSAPVAISSAPNERSPPCSSVTFFAPVSIPVTACLEQQLDPLLGVELRRRAAESSPPAPCRRDSPSTGSADRPATRCRR